MLASKDNQADSYNDEAQLAKTLEDANLVAEDVRSALILDVFEEMSYDNPIKAQSGHMHHASMF
jgi:hypothetical protein